MVYSADLTPPRVIIYWQGNTYKTLATLVNQIANQEYFIFAHWRNEGKIDPLGAMAIYFMDDAAVIDLLPIFMPVFEALKLTRPATRPELKAWKVELKLRLHEQLAIHAPLGSKAPTR